jgi:UDP-N-acetylglucosamine diphosphorylase / glucose-1-phosphate thymidylyltransferase / UDP-N-acetylgalactosamine diphosphorylase / glucosamine-1-phosphate N-acetyltransferase / galactosamine-1-phosphate N-acetyltransferase
MHICIFEDNKYSDFEPLMLSRPVYDLLCGTFTLKEKILNCFQIPDYSLHCRNYVQKITERQNPGIKVNRFPEEDCLFINGRILGNKDLSAILDISDKKKKVFIKEDQLVAAFVPSQEMYTISNLQDELFDIKYFTSYEIQPVDVPIANYIWDLINLNGEEIKNDFELRLLTHSKLNYINEVHDNVHLINEDRIFIEENVTIKPGVVLDASAGPIYIEKNAHIYSNSVVEGPFFLGEGSIIKSAATIYPNTSIGKICKAGGEIDQTIIMPYSNKQHVGFLGSSYLGSWVNIGAGTNNSTLKNNYGIIKVQFNGKEIDTGLRFLGLMMGDHSKCAISVMFNTGTIVGFASNIFGAGFPDKYIPSFAWGGAETLQTYNINKAIETAKVMTSRRKIEFTSDDEKLFEDIFNLTKSDRDKKGF